MSKQQFQTEVSQLLQLIVHSLYSHPEIFLRELISNSSDALDKLRHLTLVDDRYKALVGNGIDSPRIDLKLGEANKTLTISDTGIGMNEEDLISHLGTIARSGTKNFLAQLSGDARKDSNLIGQFGVGFYSVFMVADKIEVLSRARQAKTRPSSGPPTARPASRSKRPSATAPAPPPAQLSSSISTKRAHSTPTPGVCRRSSRSTPTTSPSPSSSPTTRASGTPRGRSPTSPASPSRSTPPPPCGSAPSPSSPTTTTRSSTSPSPATGKTRSSGSTPAPKAPSNTPPSSTSRPRHPWTSTRPTTRAASSSTSSASSSWTTPRSCSRSIYASCAASSTPKTFPLNVSREILQQNKVLTSIKTASVKKILSELKNHRRRRQGQVLAVHRRVQPPAQGRSLRRLRQPRDAARPHPLQVH